MARLIGYHYQCHPSSLHIKYETSIKLNHHHPKFKVINISLISSVLAMPPNNNNSTPKAKFIARRRETLQVQQLQRPLVEYMRLPASQYSVLDAERIERVDEDTFRCYVYRFKFINLEVCPVLLVRVNPHPLGCSINLLSCKLQGSPIVVAQNDKFEASMLNHISCSAASPLSDDHDDAHANQLTSDAVIEVSIDVPFPFRAIPVQIIESSGTRVLEQILGIMLPRFMQQLAKDYQAWASGDTSRQPLGTGQI